MNNAVRYTAVVLWAILPATTFAGYALLLGFHLDSWPILAKWLHDNVALFSPWGHIWIGMNMVWLVAMLFKALLNKKQSVVKGWPGVHEDIILILFSSIVVTFGLRMERMGEWFPGASSIIFGIGGIAFLMLMAKIIMRLSKIRHRYLGMEAKAQVMVVPLYCFVGFLDHISSYIFDKNIFASILAIKILIMGFAAIELVMGRVDFSKFYGQRDLGSQKKVIRKKG